jgi:hypothetical protein
MEGKMFRVDKQRFTALFFTAALLIVSLLSPAIEASAAPAFSPQHIQNLIRQSFGNDADEIISHMGHRVTTPTCEQHPGTKYYADIYGYHWAGYISRYNSGVAGASGYFEARQSTNGHDAAWVGVGGFDEENLAQCGVDMLSLDVWYEAYPDSPEWVFTVNAGDDLAASVGLDESTGDWFFFVMDLDTDEYFLEEIPDFTPNMNTAEWIVERVGTANVGTFGTVHFTDCRWREDSETIHSMSYPSSNPMYRDTCMGPDRWLSPTYVFADGKSFNMVAN